MLKTKIEKMVKDYLDKYNYHTMKDKMYDYYKTLPRIGGINLSFTINKTKGKNTISIFIMFDEPEKANKNGFHCNSYSGKYNFPLLADQNQIEYVFNHIG